MITDDLEQGTLVTATVGDHVSDSRRTAGEDQLVELETDGSVQLLIK